ncbi:uncharacterized protein LOC119170498 [Rhipicephalus microplus]|uniref:uncharacterized protein LOC119170498 n=1 Tax=Rhipicephalus microplus TaxID=6941 RepID=UPI003F6BA5A6
MADTRAAYVPWWKLEDDSELEDEHSSCSATLEDGESQQRQSLCSSIGVSETEGPSDVKVQKKAHTGRQLYQCHLCPRSFKWSGLLRKHLCAHTGEQPYQCPSCGKGFLYRGSLMVHLRIHTGERPYQCSYCPQRFKQQSHLIAQQRIRTGERPFNCHFCTQTFSLCASLKRHLRTHFQDSGE